MYVRMYVERIIFKKQIGKVDNIICLTFILGNIPGGEAVNQLKLESVSELVIFVAI